MLLYFRTNFNKDKSYKIMKWKNYMFIWCKILYSFFNELSKLKSDKQVMKSIREVMATYINNHGINYAKYGARHMIHKVHSFRHI